jgi:hypothetical protein
VEVATVTVIVGDGTRVGVDVGIEVAVAGVVGFAGVGVACGGKFESAQAMDKNMTTIRMSETRDLKGCLFIIIGSFVHCAPF